MPEHDFDQILQSIEEYLDRLDREVDAYHEIQFENFYFSNR
jgi:hypothetical protein